MQTNALPMAAALEAEVDAYLAGHAVERDERVRRLVVRNGHAHQREVMTAAGAVPVRAPRVDDRRIDPQTGQRARFRSVILPPWCRKSPNVAEVLPPLYLDGLSTGDFVWHQGARRLGRWGARVNRVVGGRSMGRTWWRWSVPAPGSRGACWSNARMRRGRSPRECHGPRPA